MKKTHASQIDLFYEWKKTNEINDTIAQKIIYLFKNRKFERERERETQCATYEIFCIVNEVVFIEFMEN